MAPKSLRHESTNFGRAPDTKSTCREEEKKDLTEMQYSCPKTKSGSPQSLDREKEYRCYIK